MHAHVSELLSLSLSFSLSVEPWHYSSSTPASCLACYMRRRHLASRFLSSEYTTFCFVFPPTASCAAASPCQCDASSRGSSLASTAFASTPREGVTVVNSNAATVEDAAQIQHIRSALFQ